MSGILLIHAAVATFLCGLIWTVQVVHYPLFARVGDVQFARYEREHQERIGRIVVPAMLLELTAAAWLVAFAPTGLRAAAWLGAALLVSVWLVTAFASVPGHHRLAQGFEPAVHRRLVRTNWIRTAAWTARAGLAWWMVSNGGGI